MWKKKKRCSTSLVLALSTPTRDSKLTRGRRRARPRELDISAAIKNSWDAAATGRGGDILAMMFLIKRTDNPVKFPAKSHETKKANKASYKISKSCQEKMTFHASFCLL